MTITADESVLSCIYPPKWRQHIKDNECHPHGCPIPPAAPSTTAFLPIVVECVCVCVCVFMQGDTK